MGTLTEVTFEIAQNIFFLNQSNRIIRY